MANKGRELLSADVTRDRRLRHHHRSYYGAFKAFVSSRHLVSCQVEIVIFLKVKRGSLPREKDAMASRLYHSREFIPN